MRIILLLIITNISMYSYEFPLFVYKDKVKDTFLIKLNNKTLFANTKQDQSFNTFIGSSTNDLSGSIETDEDGNIYITGFIGEDNNLFFNDGYDSIHNGSQDCFINKFSKEGKIVWGSYIGSPGLDGSFYIDVQDGRVLGAENQDLMASLLQANLFLNLLKVASLMLHIL